MSDRNAPLVLTTITGQVVYLTPPKKRALGDVEGHPFHGNQWTTGLALDKDGYDASGKPGPAIARKDGALWLYRGDGTDINDQLRSGHVTEPKVRDALDKAMKPLPHAMTVQRETGDWHPTGSTFTEKGYTSTAAHPGTFAKGGTVSIEVPAGTPAIRIGDYYAKDVEHEIILGRDTTFQVVSPTQWKIVKHRALGDVEGHPFHGNQWTTGFGDNGTPEDPADGIQNINTAERGVVLNVTHFREDTKGTFSDDRIAYFHPAAEADFSNIQEVKGVVIEGVLTLRHPKVMPQDESSELYDKNPKTKAIIAELKAKGYDGVIDEEGQEVIAFYPKTALKESGRVIGPPYGRALAEFDESKHPRDEHGKFTDGFDTTQTHYIGGDIPDNPRLPIFTTPDKSGADWYSRERADAGKGRTHAVQIEAKHPLGLHSEADVKKNLLPILDEAGVQYEFTPSTKDAGWWLEVPDISQHSPYEGTNPLDVAYIPKVRDALVRHGYDSIQATDPLEHMHDIPTTVLIKSPSQMRRVKTLSDGRALAEWEEEKHPRDDKGQFAETEGGGSAATERQHTADVSGKAWTNKAPKTAAQISGVTPTEPLKSYTLYHVTRNENVDAILKNGFDLSRVKPRWQNDYAVSLTRGDKAAKGYFAKRGQEMDESKYTLLEVKFKGRMFKGVDNFDSPPVRFAANPRDYNHKMIELGLDGWDQGRTIYLHNPRAITSIRAVPSKIRAAMLALAEWNEELHPRDEKGQFTSGPGGIERRQRTEAGVVYTRASDAKIVAERLTKNEKTIANAHVGAAAVDQMGTQSDHVNLQNLQIEGVDNHNIFGPHATNLKRGDMPQLPEDHDGQMAFFKHLSDNGVKMRVVNADPRELMATQAELDSVKVGQIYRYLLDHNGKLRGEVGPLFVSKEGAIIDGHHRWAAVASYALTHPGTKVPVAVLNVPTEKALEICDSFGKAAGIAHEGFSAGFRQRAASIKVDDFDDIVVSTPPPDAPPKPDNEHPWNWVNGQWMWIPTDTADGVPTRLDLPQTPRAAAEWNEEDHPRDEKGQFAHSEGAPGATAAAPPSQPNAPSATDSGVVTAQFKSQAETHGFKLRGINELGDETKQAMHIREAQKPMDAAAVEGIGRGLNDIHEAAPGFYELMQHEMALGYADHEPASAAATSAFEGSQATMVFNGAHSMEALNKSGDDWSIANKIAAGKNGEDRLREVYRGITVHEAGHMADAALGGRLSLSVAVDMELGARDAGKDVGMFAEDVAKSFSKYGVYGGPPELGAEVFAAVVLKQPVHPAFAGTAEMLRRAMEKPYK